MAEDDINPLGRYAVTPQRALQFGRDAGAMMLSPLEIVKRLMQHGYNPGTKDTEGVKNVADAAIAATLMRAGMRTESIKGSPLEISKISPEQQPTITGGYVPNTGKGFPGHYQYHGIPAEGHSHHLMVEPGVKTAPEIFNKIRNSGTEVPANTNKTPTELYWDAIDKQKGTPPVNITPASPQDFINALIKDPHGKFKATPEHPAQIRPPADFLYRPTNRFESNAEFDTPLAKLYLELFKNANKNE